MDKKTIDNIVWWVPFRKLRYALREFLETILCIDEKAKWMQERVGWIEERSHNIDIRTISMEQLQIKDSNNLLPSMYAINNILNSYIDITKLPPAKGLRRLEQLETLHLLQCFDKICKKYNINYWLEGGTLLGAVRHKGFVPWDDDVDVGVLRKDIDKLIDILEKEKYIFGIEVSIRYYMLDCYIISVGKKVSVNEKKHLLGQHLDIFVFDVYTENDNNIDFKNNIKKYLTDLRNYNEACLIHSWNYNEYTKEELYTLSINMKNKILEYTKTDPECIEENSTIFRVIHLEGYPQQINPANIIFPLSKLKFEGYEFSVPANSDAYLQLLYRDYMQLPKKAHHH